MPRPGLGGHTALIAAAADHRDGDRQRPGRVIARHGAPQHGSHGAERIRFHQGRFGELPEAVEEAGFERWMACWRIWG